MASTMVSAQLDKPAGEAYGKQWWVVKPVYVHWNCTQVITGATACCNSAVYSDDNSGGLCVDHAYTAGILPVLNVGHSKATLEEIKSVQWGAANVLNWVCTVGTGDNKDTQCGKSAVYRPPLGEVALLYGSGLCAHHAEYFLTPAQLETLDTVGITAVPQSGDSKVIKGLPAGGMAYTVWTPKFISLNWVCTYSNCGAPAQWKSVEGTAGLCEKHAALMAEEMVFTDASPKSLSPMSHTTYSAHTPKSSLEYYKPGTPPKPILDTVCKPVIPKVKAKEKRGVDTADPLGIPWEQDWNTLHGVHSVPSKKQLGEIGLDEHLSLPQAACEFYLLMDAALCTVSPGQQEAEKQFKLLTEYLAGQMSLYIECACLGEARYAVGRVQDIENAKFLQNPKWHSIYTDLCDGDKDRYTVWRMFPALSRKYSGGSGRSRKNTALLLFTVLVHDSLPWRSGGFGGKKWAECAKTVLAYRRGRIDAVSFVDTAFGLKHNGNIVFDKLWDVSGIEHILDANQRGDMGDLCTLASTEVADLWKAVSAVG